MSRPKVCTYTEVADTQFAWDPEKARSNRVKHRVSFDLAQKVFEDPLHIVVLDRVSHGEERWHAIGR